MTDVATERRRVNYELKAVDGSRLITILSFRTMEQVMRAAPKVDERVLSIWAVPESNGSAHLVAVRNKGDAEWTRIEEPREE